MRMKKIQQQVEEGELLIENHKLQVEFEDNHCVRRNRTQLFVSRVITIQRAWRYYKKQQQLQKQQKEHQDHKEFKENYKKDEDDDNNDENTCHQLDGNGNPKPVGNSVEEKNPANNQQTHNFSGDKMSMLTKLSADNQPDIIQGLTHHSPDLHNENESYLKRPKDLDKKNTNLNRLSLAEEFAQLEGKIFADDGVYESESESDYGATPSSCMTTPDWEAQEEFSKADESQDNITVTEDLNEADESHDTTTTVCNGLQKDHAGNVADLDANANDSDTSETHINELQSSCSQKHLEILTDKRTMSTEINTKTEPNRTSNKEEIAKDIDITCKHLAAATITAAACDHRQVLPKDNIDSSGLPIMDWDTLEKRIANIERKKGEKAKELEKQEEEEQSSKSPKTAQRSCRQEILKRLARAGLSEEDAEGDIYGKGRDKLSARLQSGMNLQICFMNDPLSDDDEDVQHEAAMMRSLQSPSVTVTKVDEDFETRQARLQNEAKIALAQAEPMAKMQLEIEKVHGKKVSPVTELAGVKGMCDISPGLTGKALSKKKLHAMSCSKLKILVNDLHRRIKDWNEELVELLIARDELKNEQDSKLIDIEDLTRHAAEQQEQQQLVRRVLSGKWP
ncbi:uncharacterized protein LOC117117096 isoform X1 [Anneissia japonica]|uniref:uncharacterized protein LOC117117096 isoform X1 n=1 Tax=Anneissia japonica TaxID=1529436 RepID=UPI00142558BC|nr:uncharacterized protein LOC117117096 isoform X1 [Anneissia japonica]XP_033117172.1 uncharacterized protein LOC117117096 isoform X1 [Anneissia japonica]